MLRLHHDYNKGGEPGLINCGEGKGGAGREDKCILIFDGFSFRSTFYDLL